MNHCIAIPSFLTLIATLCSIFFLSCNPGAEGSEITQSALFAQAPGPPISVTGGPSNVAIGDMNKDGNPDLVVTSEKARTITVLLGAGGSDAISDCERCSYAGEPWRNGPG